MVSSLVNEQTVLFNPLMGYLSNTNSSICTQLNSFK